VCLIESLFFFLGKIGGVEINEAVNLYKYIKTNCSNLFFVGLRTVEEPGDFHCFEVCLYYYYVYLHERNL
jgi:hypothetical protein